MKQQNSSVQNYNVKELLFNKKLIGQQINVKGWVRTRRGSKKVNFIALNDGSIVHNIQVVIEVPKFDEELLKQISTGTCISVEGELVKSFGKGQEVEIQANNIYIYGKADPLVYPLQKKQHSFEFLREIAHLRPRTSTFGAIFRIRHALSFAIHKYFNEHGFYYIHTPIITASDCEGAGEMFRVTILDPLNPPKTPEGKVDYSQDFFGKETKLTVSGQLEAELAALALSKVYTFGPTFRAENSNTPRHLAEFWMIEPEMAFCDINDNMDIAENLLKYILKYVLENALPDIDFLAKKYGTTIIERLNFVINNKFERISYTHAIEILEKSKQEFEFPVKWGNDLQTEHERYLVEKYFKKPVCIIDYPKDIKAFYMKQNDDNKTVRALDVLFPYVGEIIGGSQREESYEKLYNRIKELKLPLKDLWWYLETRKFGTAPHSGFGLGLERLLLFITAMHNIRDVIPFPRTPNNAEF